MRKFAIIRFVVTLLLLLIYACASSLAPKDTAQPASAQQIEFSAVYIRSNWQSGDYPKLINIRSMADLDVDHMAAIPAKSVSDDFFAKSMLVIVILQEGSGATRHAVESIDNDGNIVINRLLPEMGTADMALWTIVIELPKAAAPEQFKLTLIDKQS